MWKMPVARAPAFLLRRILSCAIAVAVLLSASVQDVHGQGWGLDYVWQLSGYRPPAGNGRWQTVGEQDFDRRVLKGTLPAVVYFDAANGCDGADGVFTSLSARRKGILTVFRVDIAAHPHVARAYDVKDDVVFVLFTNGRAVKRATAPEVLERVLTKNGGLYSDERFLAEKEAFLDQKQLSERCVVRGYGQRRKIAETSRRSRNISETGASPPPFGEPGGRSLSAMPRHRARD